MASVRKRSWGRKSAFVVDYIDLDGKRRLQTFQTERAAEVFKTAMVYALQVEASSRMPSAVEPAKIPSETLSLLWGADAIADVLGISRRSAFHMLETGQLPAKKVGSRWVVERATLEKVFA